MYTRIKTHVCANKKFYIVAATSAIAGGMLVYVLANHKDTEKISMRRILSPGDNNVLKVYISPLGDPGNVVQCVETGTIYASQNQAAREIGVDRSIMSKHLNGENEHILGQHYVVLGKAGQPLAE